MALPRSDLRETKLGIFDWNGTLSDDLPVAIASTGYIFKYFKTAIPLDLGEKYRREIISNFKGFYYKYGLPTQVSPEEMTIKRNEYWSAHQDEIPLREGALNALHLCRVALGLKLAILTSEVRESLEKQMSHLQVAPYFDAVYSDTRDKEKDLAKVCRNFHLAPSRAFYVDDTVEGIRAASACGVIPVSLITPTSYAPEGILREAAEKYGAVTITNLWDLVSLF